MRWLANLFANALARRVAALVVAGVIAFFSTTRAEAQDFSACYSDQPSGVNPSDIRCPDRGVASAQANRLADKLHLIPTARPACTYHTSGGVGWYRCLAYPNSMFPYEVGRGFLLADQCSPGQIWNDASQGCQKPCTNAAQPPLTMHSLPVTGSTQCLGGCVFTYAQNADDTSTASVTGAMCRPSDFKNNCPAGTHWNDHMVVCEPEVKECPPDHKESNGQCVPDGKCPENMIAVQGSTPGAVQQGALYCKPKVDECPAGTIKAPATGKCIPGEGQCAVGEARRENGTCGKDKDGDGKADEDDDNPDNDPDKESASGGDDCNSPPSCSGGAIACLQVKIQWRIDCNTRRAANISGGTCDAVPVCTGKKCDAMEYAQLMQQWRATCALEKIAKNSSGETGTDGTDANKNGVADALEGAVGSAGAGETPTVTKFGAGFSTSVIDRENIFGGGSCPQPPTFKFMGATVSGSDFPYFCQAMAILRALILIFGAYTALKILMGWGY